MPVASFARIPHNAVPAIREAVRDPPLIVPASSVDVAELTWTAADRAISAAQDADTPTALTGARGR